MCLQNIHSVCTSSKLDSRYDYCHHYYQQWLNTNFSSFEANCCFATVVHSAYTFCIAHVKLQLINGKHIFCHNRENYAIYTSFNQPRHSHSHIKSLKLALFVANVFVYGNRKETTRVQIQATCYSFSSSFFLLALSLLISFRIYTLPLNRR